MNPKSILVLAVFLCAVPAGTRLHAEPPGKGTGATSRDVSAAEVNGTWQCRKNTFKIWALGNGKLQMEFDGVFEYKSPSYGPMANLGNGSGVATIAGDTAVFVPTGDEGGGKITLKFSRGKLIVEQEGTCGFGHRVYATGTYAKISARKPKFGE
jgi:hypothetical protein